MIFMKASQLILTLCMLGTALSGCSSIQDSDVCENTYLHIKSCNAPSELTDFGMFVTNQNGTVININGENSHVIQEHGIWKTPPIVIKLGQNMQLFAYYPYSESVSVTDIPVSLSAQTDYLYSKGQTVTYSSFSANIELFHLLSKVTIKVNEEYVENLSVSDYPAEGTLNLFAGTISKRQTSTTTVQSTNNAILLFPGYTDIIVDITFRGKSYHYPVTVNLEPGKKYVYSLVLQENNKLEIDKVSVSSWETGGNYEGIIEPET